MDYTYTDYFNYYLKEFLNETINNFPETQTSILSNYRDLLEGRNSKSDMYAKYFMTKINNHLISIAKKDDTLFNHENLVFVEGVDFHTVWNSEQCTTQNKTAIWKYLQMLMLIGRKIIPDHKEIVDMLKKVGDEVSVPAKVEKTLTELTEDEKEEEAKKNDVGFDMGNLLNMASGLKGMGGLGDLGGLGGLGDLGENGGMDIGNIFKNLSESLGDLNFDQMPNMPHFDTDSNVENDENDGDNENSENNNEEGDSTHTKPQTTTSGLFADLATEMTNTFNFEEMENNGEPPKNVGEALGKFMSGDNPAKLMQMVSKFGSKLQNDISSGKVNQNDLMKETMQMMSNLQKGANNPEILKKQAEQLIGDNPELKSKLKQMSGKNISKSESTSTKDRLRAKLEARKNNNE